MDLVGREGAQAGERGLEEVFGVACPIQDVEASVVGRQDDLSERGVEDRSELGGLRQKRVGLTCEMSMQRPMNGWSTTLQTSQQPSQEEMRGEKHHGS